MKNRFIQQTALFMICLMITLPFYVSSAYADINDVKAYGKKGIENFVTRDYDLTVEADIEGDIDAKKVRLKHESGLATTFDSCSKAGGNVTTSKCRLNVVKGVDSEVEICPSTAFNVELYETIPGFPIDTTPLEIKCDSLAPIVDLSVSSTATKGQDIILSYHIQDLSNSLTRCSGISKIEFYPNSLESGPATLVTNSTGCDYSGSTRIPVSAYNDGKVVVFLKAYDLLDQAGVENISFIVDKNGPDAEATVTITDMTGKTINFFEPQNVLVDVELTITDLIGVESYTLDYSDLTTASPNCIRSGSDILCKWQNIQTYMETPSFSKTIILRGIDSLGNNATRNVAVTKVIEEDKTAPSITITDIIVDTPDGSEMSWFRPREMKMSFKAQINDDISGIESISGDFSSIEIISGDKPNCVGSDKSYICTWSNLRFYMNTATLNKPIKIVAKDNARNEKIESKTAQASYRADNSAPVISNLTIIRSDGLNLSRWMNRVSVPLKITTKVTEQGAGLDTLQGDFTSINPLYNAVEAVCTQTKGSKATETTVNSPIYQEYVNTNATTLPKYEYECTWTLDTDFKQSGKPFNAPLKVNATDNSGNSGLPVFTQAFNVDVDGPIATSLITSNLYKGKYYAGIDPNTFIATVDDLVGFNQDGYVYIDLKNIGLETSIRADNCSGNKCYWQVHGVRESLDEEKVYEISVNRNTRDDLNNGMDQAYVANVSVDVIRPVIKSVNISAVAGTTQIYQEFIQTGNGLNLIVKVTESNSILSATADLSNFISDETEDLADNFILSDDNKTWTFTWATDEIDIKEYKKDNIYLKFIDIAGNTIVHPYEIEVFEALEEGAYNYWDNRVGASSPNAIDKQLITFYNPSMWFTVGLTSTEGKSGSERWPLEVVIESCGGKEFVESVIEGENKSEETKNNSTRISTPSSNYLSSVNGNLPILVNPNTGKSGELPYNMYMDYELEQALPDSDSIDIMCTIKIKTLVDQRKISPYEYENITVTINYYNNPLGSLDENIQKEIDDVKNSWLVDAGWIGKINDIIQIAKTICGLVKKLVELSTLLGGISDILKSNIYTEAAGIVTGNTATVTAGASETLWSTTGNKLCKWLNCQLYYGKDWGGEGKDGISANNIVADFGRTRSKYSKFWTPENSLITSVVFLCLPGILYNLQKARVIECQYVKCLKLTAAGMPLQMCVKQRDYAWCSYVYGELFNLIPFAGMINQLMQKIKLMLSQPAELIGVAIKAYCKGVCASPSPGCKVCVVIEALNLVVDLLCDFGIGSDQCEPFWDDLKVDDSVCDDL